MKTYEDYLEEEEYEMVMKVNSVPEIVNYTKDLEVYNVDSPEIGYKVISARELKGWNGNHSVIWENGGFEYCNIFTKFGGNHDEDATEYKYRVRNKAPKVQMKYKGYIIVDKTETVFSTVDHAERVLRNFIDRDGYQVVYAEEI